MLITMNFFVILACTHTICTVTARPEINAKFYGESVNVEQLLFQNHPRPKAAQPLYDAINAAMNLEVPEKGFKPTQVLNRI